MVWLAQLRDRLVVGTPREEIIQPLLFLDKVVAYVADASAGSLRLSARATGAINAARRALWLKTWSGDSASKLKLCGLPFKGGFLFDPELDLVLDRSADKKGFSPPKKKIPTEFRGQKIVCRTSWSFQKSKAPFLLSSTGPQDKSNTQ